MNSAIKLLVCDLLKEYKSAQKTLIWSVILPIVKQKLKIREKTLKLYSKVLFNGYLEKAMKE